METTFFILLAAGLFIGLFSGMIGVGGGTLMIPLFRVALGLDPIVSTATSLFTIIPTSISGFIGHLRAKTCLPKLGLAMGLAGACTSPLGVWLANESPGWLVICAAALAIGYSACDMLRKALRMTPASKDVAANAPATKSIAYSNPSTVTQPRTDQAQTAQPPNERTKTAQSSTPHPQLVRKDYLRGAAIGAIAGLLSGYIGLGGGFLMIPLMLGILGLPMKLASGTSLIAIMILAIPGVVEQGLLGNVNYFAGIAVACGSIPGALIGARLNRYVPERALRLVFASFLGVAAIIMVVKELGFI